VSDRHPYRVQLCALCARAFRARALPQPPYELPPYDLRALDPQGYFCSLLCAARFGVAACELRPLASVRVPAGIAHATQQPNISYTLRIKKPTKD